MCLRRALYFLVLVFIVDAVRVRHHSTGKQALKFLRGIGVHNKKMTSANGGLWPRVFNLATKALISSNATCGEGGREEFCRMSEGSRGRCGICDNFSTDPTKKHPATSAIDDGTNRWWQSPALYYGAQYEYVTITLDLKQVYQVAYVIVKAANSPRPGAWILERSIDGENYAAWQYFATSDKDCLDRYGIPARKGKPHYFTDSEVICTSSYSKLMPMENGEIHTFLIHGRPGANETSPELLQFTKARYVRLRLQGLRGSVEPLPAWLSQDIARDKRLYYSIRDINIGGQCMCNGHASSCRHNVASGHPECECAHHTCGPNCERCCPLFNQRQWGQGTSRDARICHPCNCHGHSKSCHYDEDVDRAGLSLDTGGYYQGGGVCDNCTQHTTGINCEKCAAGYHRPLGTKPDADVPCVRCNCDEAGSKGHCSYDGTSLRCECKPGYVGPRCDECSEGFRGYPNCETCPCDPRGVLMDECEGDCVCKPYVDGKFCDHCKPGYFSLQDDNPDGCSACYCSGATTVCEAAHLLPRAYQTGDGWLITDISVSEIEEPTLDERNMISVGNYEIPGIEAYYWLAPSLYLGNKLETYGSDMVFKVHWVVIRGDTSGKPTAGPNIIIVGANGMRIASGDDLYPGTNMTFRIKLAEYDRSWYHVPYSVKDIVTRLRRTEYKGDFVTRPQFLSVLSDVKYILLRAKFHTDQIEGSLEEAIMYSGEFQDGYSYSAVEQCSCPSGYTGLSCESCQYGYVRILSNTTTHQQLGFCVKCDCNGHSSTCNADTGECFCEHSTIGETCERCAAGYYGNPLLGTIDDCKKCACPLEDEENNFSPSCQLDSSSLSNDDDEPGYVCTQCPKGYTGDHCEICDDGYFGVPSKVGGRCELCSCGGGPCDRITGQCLGCRGNTEGWRCERCKAGFHGDPVTGCEACLCDPQGSIKPDCNNVTGECECKEHFIGRTCNKCEAGYGNVTAQCTACSCHPMGAKSGVCDPHSGLCECHPGVEGFHCDACQHLHYGFSEIGCQSCKCNKNGSELSTCDIITGQCRCKPYYTGRTCDNCEAGFWDSPTGCRRCECDPDGAESQNCDRNNGKCLCKPGVDGSRCDSCAHGHYGFSKIGCKACETCDKVGHVCDPDTGRCVCPAHSHGDKCHNCKPNTFGHQPNKGCKPCNCSATGSIKAQCNLQTGICYCQQGYVGYKCDSCEHGYYGYPKCRRCSCSFAGTDKDLGKCDSNGICQCNSDGSCPCKANVSGRRCSHCKDGNFGLHVENQNGCTQCFCFGRSTVCKEAGYTWDKIRAQNRSLTVDFIDNYKTQSQRITSKSVDLNYFEEIEGTTGDVKRNHDHFNIPLYWKLPKNFNGDRVLSYGGYLRFYIATFGPNMTKNNLFTQYPLVRIEGNDIKLYYDPPTSNLINNRFEIRMHESSWKCEHTANKEVSRELLMIALQRITGIYIRASDYSVFEKISFGSVSLDTAIQVPGNPPPIAMGVEKCDCPQEYSGTSCQNPNTGYYRYQTDHHPITSATVNKDLIDAIIGKSRHCQCNNRSSVCDIETGECLNCTENTAGKLCERCAEGYYGDPMHVDGQCVACACPSPTQNFAITCSPNPKSNYFICKCKKGYFGPTCDRCSAGYYGQPHIPGGSCQPCNCNKDGRINNECDQQTGHCNCKSGITGNKCSQCEQPRHVLENNECIPCDTCIQILLDGFETMSSQLVGNTSHLQDGVLHPPWESLREFENKYSQLQNDLDTYIKNQEGTTIDDEEVKLFEADLKELKAILAANNNSLVTIMKVSNDNSLKAQKIMKVLSKTEAHMKRLLKSLNEFGKSHISIKEAVRKGQGLLSDIKKKFAEVDSFTSAYDVIEKCQLTYDTLKKLVGSEITHPHIISANLTDLNIRLKDLDAILNDIDVKNNQGASRNELNEKYYDRVKAILLKLDAEQKQLKHHLKSEDKLISETKKLLSGIEDNYKIFEESRDALQELIKQGENKEENLDQTIELVEIYTQQIDEHTKSLQKNITDYKDAFNLSTEELDIVRISDRFKQIVEELKKVNQTIYDAKTDINDIITTTINPSGYDSIYVNTSIAMAKSDSLITRVAILKNQMTGINERSGKLHGFVTDLKYKNWDNGLRNNENLEKINSIKQSIKGNENIYSRIKSHMKDVGAHSDDMRKVYTEAMNINISKQYGLLKNYQKYLNLTSTESLRNLQENVKVTKELLQNITTFGNKTNIDIIKNMNQAFENFANKKTELQDKLDQLKGIIKRANQMATIILVPMNGNNCYRTYKIRNLVPSTLTTVSIQLTTNEVDRELLYISNQDQFLQLQVIDRKIILSWKFSSDMQTLTSEPTDKDTDVKINVERINNLMKFSVNNLNYSNLTASVLFNISSANLLHLGGFNNTVKGLPGCIKDMVFNGQRVGLWQFVDSVGECSGCYSSRNKAIQGLLKYRFNGEGYIADVANNTNPTEFNVKFKMRTFDEDALLFLAYYEGTYMSISLQRGYLHCELHYRNTTLEPIILKSDNIYNNGNEVLVECTKIFNNREKQDLVVLSINDREKKDLKRTVPKSEILKIKKASLFYGGVPPNFAAVGFEKQSFLGTLYEVSLSSLPLSLQTTQYYGIEPQTREEVAYKDFVFSKGGFVKLNYTVKGIKQVTFIVRTTSNDGLLIGVGDKPILFTMKNGKLLINLDGKEFLESKSVINNDEYHSITLKISKSIILYVDEIEQKRIKIDSRNNFNIANISIGGLKDEPNTFIGVLKDIIILDENDKSHVIYADSNTYLEARAAQIGRHKALEKNVVITTKKRTDFDITQTENDSMKDMQQTDGCDKISYNLEPNAVKFGDAPNSYVQHNLKDSFWKNDYSIEFEFRTFYKDGLLFISFGPKEHYTMLEIKDARIHLHVKGKRSKKSSVGLKIDDGNWHQISIHYNAKNKRKLSITVDGETKKIRVPQNKIGGKLFFGDFSKSEPNVPRIMGGEINPFRGCIRSLKINDIPQGIINNKNTLHHNIGQCFPNIEKGSYFRGDSYAVYNNFYRLNNILELSFDFRTSEQNGIFLSIANIENSPALSIELQNGAVVMSVDMGSGIITNVTNKLSKYTICNNKWHHVTAIFSSELTVIVDGVSQSWVLSDMGLLEQIEAPLYIGGLPDSAPGGTLKIRENFKGCIHNLLLGNKNVDWINMEELNNVSLNSCPVIL